MPSIVQDKGDHCVKILFYKHETLPKQCGQSVVSYPQARVTPMDLSVYTKVSDWPIDPAY